MKTGAIIFSRMNSKRLPGKALKLISGKPLIEWVVDRVKQIRNVDHICIATTKNAEDDLIEEFATSKNIDFYRGKDKDVAHRALGACLKFNYKNFLRICGDRPFIDSNIFEELISKHTSKIDITTNLFPRCVPPGLSAEIINIKALKKIISISSNDMDREHITRYIYNNPDKFIIKHVNHNNKFNDQKNIRLVVDSKEDLLKIRWITEKNKADDLDSSRVINNAIKWETLN